MPPQMNHARAWSVGDHEGWKAAASRELNGHRRIWAVRRPKSGLSRPSTSRSMKPT